MLNWWHNFIPDPVLLELGWLRIYWYGLIMALAILTGWFVVNKLAAKRGFNTGKLDNILFYTIICGLLGARLYDVILFWDYYQNNLSDIYKVWNGGMAIHGSIIAGGLTIFILCKKYNWPILKLLDLSVIGVALGQAIGRWGNFFNQEIFGLPTDLPWGIYIESINRPVEYINSNYFHPTFLYESLLNLVLFIGLYFVYKSKKILTGLNISLYLIGYSLIRFFLEYIRLDDTPLFWGLRFPQFISVIIIILVTIFWLGYWLLSKYKKPV